MTKDLALSNNFTVTISTFPEDEALQDITLNVLSSAVQSYDYTAELPDPADAYDDDELEGDGEVIASADEFDDEDSHDDAVDEALETIQDMISPSQLLTLHTTVTPKVIVDLKAIYESQDVGYVTEVLVTYFNEDREPLFYHLFSGYLSPVRALNGSRVGCGEPMLLSLEMDVAEVKTFCLENPSPVRPTVYAPL